MEAITEHVLVIDSSVRPQLNFKLFNKIELNPLTPVPPVTVRDEPWPFFHF